MTRTRLALMTIACVAAMQWASAQEPDQVLSASQVDRVRQLYESAAYEEALEAIKGITAMPAAPASGVAVLQRYRALCLLALDRSSEAERAVEAILTQDPSYSPSANDTSPRFVALLDRTRSRVLPVLAQKSYEDAKRDFDDRRLQEAATGFARVIALLEHPSIDSSTPASRDLRTLATGFLQLSRPPAPSAVSQETTGSVPETPALETVSAPTTIDQGDRSLARPAASLAHGRIYSADDLEVTPPETVRQDLPNWNNVGTARFPGRFQGQLDIVIDETGSVESATLVKSIFPAYNALAIAGARDWKYKPATRDGVPVKFRKPVLITLSVPK
jgi:TonB family protein